MKHAIYSQVLFWVCSLSFASSGEYLIGTGISDISGSPAGVVMMGYVKLKQQTSGIHTRLRSRAFIVADPMSPQRLVFVSADICHIYDAITQAVIKKLKKNFGNLYTESNVMITATHTHSGPGGYSHYKLYHLTTLGFSEQTFNIIVDGIYESIVRAHQNLHLGTVKLNIGELLNASRNRAPEAYVLNPESERNQYNHDTDKRMIVLKFERATGEEIGVIAWFAVHATSMQVSNSLISADNKGHASQMFERFKNTNYYEKDTFAAAFPNSSAGDSSPNLAGDLNGDRDWDCHFADSFLCTKESGEKHFDKARDLFDSASEPITGTLEHRHTFVDFSNLTVHPQFTQTNFKKTCFPAIGVSMLAGAKDHFGVGDEGVRCSDGPGWVKALCLRPRMQCHGEKPVAIATGLKKPYPWTPEVLPIQIFKVGQLGIVAVPGEFTTMSSRRLLNTTHEVLSSIGVREMVLAGYANAYAGYVATREEYQLQNYEGASTHFGEWTLSGYQQEFYKIAKNMALNEPVKASIRPRDLSAEIISRRPKENPYDTVPAGKWFGETISNPRLTYRRGEMVQATFWGANPNNDPHINHSFLEIQHKMGDSWKAVFYDWDPETRYHWKEVEEHRSNVTIEWEIPQSTPIGEYRIFHRGKFKLPNKTLMPYQDVSRSFTVKD